MKYLLVLCVGILLIGCGENNRRCIDNNQPSDIDKAQQEYVCKTHFGVYEYGVNNWLQCNDGFKMLTKDSWNITNPEVYEELLKIQNRKNIR